MIQDNTRCIGCRACMVACKSWNDRPEDKTDFFAGEGYQNPRDLDANNYNLITFNEIVTGAQPDWAPTSKLNPNNAKIELRKRRGTTEPGFMPVDSLLWPGR